MAGQTLDTLSESPEDYVRDLFQLWIDRNALGVLVKAKALTHDEAMLAPEAIESFEKSMTDDMHIVDLVEMSPPVFMNKRNVEIWVLVKTTENFGGRSYQENANLRVRRLHLRWNLKRSCWQIVGGL